MATNNENLEMQINKPQGEEQPLTKVKQINVVMLNSESVISPAVAEDTRKTYSNAPNFTNSSHENQKSRQPLFAKRTLFISAGILALLSFAALGALFFNNQKESPLVSQQIPPDTSNVPAVSQASSQPQPASEKSNDADIAVRPDTSKIKESAPVIIKNSSTAETKRDVQSPALEKPQLPPAEVDGNTQTELNASLNEWVDATNTQNVDQQMTYYAPKLNSFYRSRNASINAVRDEKKRVFDGVDAVDIKAGKPQIVLSRDGRTATMVFRKKYSIKKGEQNRNGEVIQEMKWVKSNNGWSIVSERDVKVVNK
jgi:cytoskeletal protein RodZ